MQNIVGIDVGGANLKYVHSGDEAFSTTFPMWRHPDRLTTTLIDHLRRFGPIDALAVTMTGELADCFVDRASGVDHIVTHTCEAAKRVGIDQVAFYAVDGRFRDRDQARRDVDCVAAANWHALANLVAKRFAADTTLIDIGSTTTDIIPIVSGAVATQAVTDHDRLAEGSLVYIGCRRTPVCALVDRLRFRGRDLTVMNEVFATIDDAKIVLGSTVEDDTDTDSADQLPRTCEFAANRLARMVGLDRRSVTIPDARELARQIVASAKQRIGADLRRTHRSNHFVISGHGQDLIDFPQDSVVIQLADQLGPSVARCAPAFAVAALLREVASEAKT